MEYIQNDASGILDSETFSAVVSAVNRTRMLPFRNKIKTDSAKKMSALQLSGKKHQVSDLDFLRFFWNVQGLEVVSDRLHSIAPLAQLKGLQTLYLENATLDTLLPIASCTRLTEVRLINVRIGDHDFSPLRQLPELKTLDLQNCEVTDLAWLSGHPKLESLELDENEIRDFSPIKTAPALKTVCANWKVFTAPFTELLSQQEP